MEFNFKAFSRLILITISVTCKCKKNGKVVRFKKFHGLHDDLKFIRKEVKPWPLSCTEIAT